ncbi:ABC transporter substrate-binding protein, partial [Halobacteriales archaeon QH_1_68_42]
SDGGDGTDYQEGGRLEFGIERSDIGNYDQAESTVADDSTVFNLVYDDLFVQNPEGERYLWMAERYETTAANDVTAPDDYFDYMGEYDIATVEEGVASLDTEWPNVVLMRHPEDVAAVADGDLGEGDSMRALTRNEAPDAVADGVFGTRIEGTLHEGIEFHNGEECTAGNIVNSYDRFAESTNQGQIFDSFLAAEAPNGEDGYEFVLYAQEADAIAEVELPPFFFFPSEHNDIEPGGLDPRDGGPVPVGTGPYEIAEFEAGSQLLLERTDNYWLEEVGIENKEWWDGPEDFPAAPVVEEVNVRFVPEGGTRVAALRDGDLDISYQLPAGERTSFDENEDFTVVSAQSTGFDFMTFSVEDTDEGGAFAEQQARHAVNNLIPRQAIVDIVSEGWGSPARVPYPAPAAGLASEMSYEEVQQEDWAYPVEPDPGRAEELMNETSLDTPVGMVLETNADDEERQDRVALIVDELNQSGLFEAELETPADITPWFVQDLTAEDSAETYAQRNAVTYIGLAAGFDPHGYAEALHHPNNYNGCCNWHFDEGTFDWIDDLDACRFGVDVAQDPDLRRQRYDDLWPQVAESMGTTIVEYSLETAVAGPDVRGYTGYPDRRGFLSYSLYAPYDESFAWLDR